MTVSQISDLEADRYQLPDMRTLLRLAKALRCSIDDILGDVDPDYSSMLIETAEAKAIALRLRETDEFDGSVTGFDRNDIPVIQEGDASPTDRRGEFRTISGAEPTPEPYDDTEHDAYALVLRGDSMEPVLKSGMRLIVSVIQPVADGDLAYAQLKAGERIATIVARVNRGWLLSSANPAYAPRFVPKEEIECIHKIVYVRTLG
jgi:phage repressor protein C with HTH and peptisase S24 domain